MSAFVKKSETPKEKISLNVKPFILPFYIIFSAVFIVYVAYSYANQIVYRAGIQFGQQQAQEVSYNAGYQAAITQLMDQAGNSCDSVAITLGDKQVNVVNMLCIQEGPAPQANMEEVQ